MVPLRLYKKVRKRETVAVSYYGVSFRVKAYTVECLRSIMTRGNNKDKKKKRGICMFNIFWPQLHMFLKQFETLHQREQFFSLHAQNQSLSVFQQTLPVFN